MGTIKFKSVQVSKLCHLLQATAEKKKIFQAHLNLKQKWKLERFAGLYNLQLLYDDVYTKQKSLLLKGYSLIYFVYFISISVVLNARHLYSKDQVCM